VDHSARRIAHADYISEWAGIGRDVSQLPLIGADRTRDDGRSLQIARDNNAMCDHCVEPFYRFVFQNW
jgi:hypothetical protein